MEIFFIVLIIIFVIILVLFVFAFILLKSTLFRPKKKSINVTNSPGESWKDFLDLSNAGKEYVAGIYHEEVSIKSLDGLTLKAIYIPASKKTTNTIISVHGWKGYGLQDHGMFMKFYHENNYNILVVDNRAHGKSDGKYIGFGFLDRLDVIEWSKFIINNTKEDNKEVKIMLHGISMGAATVLMTSGEDLPKEIKGIVSDCAYTSAWDEFSHVMKNQMRFPVFPILYFCSFLSKMIIGYNFKECSSLDKVKNAKIPILFIHGDIDTFVPTDMVYKLYDACPSDKTLYIAPNSIHANSFVRNPDNYIEHLCDFLKKINMI